MYQFELAHLFLSISHSYFKVKPVNATQHEDVLSLSTEPFNNVSMKMGPPSSLLIICMKNSLGSRNLKTCPLVTWNHPHLWEYLKLSFWMPPVLHFLKGTISKALSGGQLVKGDSQTDLASLAYCREESSPASSITNQSNRDTVPSVYC